MYRSIMVKYKDPDWDSIQYLVSNWWDAQRESLFYMEVEDSDDKIMHKVSNKSDPQDPRFTDPEKTWVSNSSIATHLGVRW